MLNKFKFITNYLTRLFDPSWQYSQRSYSQEGEDLILQNLFGEQEHGFYVDIGAHHPFRFSNTYLFYKRGWRGINIDATPDSMRLFHKYRHRDINLEIPVANNTKSMDYYIFDEPALNSFSYELSNHRDKHTSYKIKQVISLKASKLATILNQYLPQGAIIDFLSIDVEGYETEVLKSNDWNKYRPRYILIEILNITLEKLAENKISRFLKKLGYSQLAITGRTVVFRYDE